MRALRLITSLLLMFMTACDDTEATKEVEETPTKPLVEWTVTRNISKAHMRGLDVASDGTIWASGVKGTVLRSLDNGTSWDHFQIKDAALLDFRDIESFSRTEAVAISAGNGLSIYRTDDGGAHWTLVYNDTNKKVFFDGIDFNGAFGLAYGDPIADHFMLIESRDSGRTWQSLDKSQSPSTQKGEAGFAASGTGIVLGRSAIWIASGGGEETKVHSLQSDQNWTSTSLPMSSSTTSGVFSIAFLNDHIGIAVGGDYVDSTNASGNAAYTTDGGKSWSVPQQNPRGYRSCVAFHSSGIAIATGRSGTDYSLDSGKIWTPLSDQGFYSCQFSNDQLIGVGRNGLIGLIDLKQIPSIIPYLSNQ